MELLTLNPGMLIWLVITFVVFAFVLSRVAWKPLLGAVQAREEGIANATPYSAAKAAVIAMTKALGRELATTGVLVNCLTPAMAETDLLREMTPEYIATIKAKIPMGRLCRVEEVAEMTAWLAGPACTFTTGAAFDLSGGRATY